jgi:soluble P-type ATPase
MRASNLAYLAEAIGPAVEREIANPHVPKSVIDRAKAQSIKVIAGIPSPDPAAESKIIDEAKEERRKVAMRYRHDADILASTLAKHDIGYLAITPTVAWNNLCLQAEIYRVNPDNNGQVLVSKKPLQGIEERAVAIIGSRPLKGLAIGALLSGASTTALMLYLAAPIALVALGGTIALVVGGYATSEWTDYRNVDHGYVRPEVLAKVERKLLEADLADHKTSLEKLWPDYQEPTTGVRVGIELPPAPADVQENLVKAHRAGLTVSLATVADAVAFSTNPVDALLKTREHRYGELKRSADLAREAKRIERERMRALRADPIATVSYGSATAIIAQYGGDFPAERDLIDRVLNQPEWLF